MMTEKESMEPVIETDQTAEETTAPSSDSQSSSHQSTDTNSAGDETPSDTSEAASADLESQLQAAVREAQENHDRYLRTAAELDNFRKRKEREVNDLRKYANQALLRELLAVVDNLERALAAAREGGEQGGLAEGVEMTLKELLKIFDQFGVKPIASLQQPFDPNLHEAVMQEPRDGVPPNTVIQELQRGYLLRDRLLRPAMVVVSKESV